MPLVLNSWGSGWPETLYNSERTLKGSPILVRHFLSSGTKHQWNKSRKLDLIVQAFLLYNQKTGIWYLSFSFKTQEFAAL